MQSATTGLPEHMCAANMKKNHFVLSHMGDILEALTRGLPFDVLTRGYGVEHRGVTVSYQANAPVLGAVLPSNSPGVHTLWLPVMPMQVGLVLKPGPQEPWTPYRMCEAFAQAGFPREAFSIYPGGGEVGAAVLQGCERAMIFGGTATVKQYHGNPRVQPHGPGFSKILLGDDLVDKWENYLDTHGRQRAGQQRPQLHQLFGHLGVAARPRDRRRARPAYGAGGPLADGRSARRPWPRLPLPGAADAINDQIEQGLKQPGVTEVTAKYRGGPRLVKKERCDYLRPTVLHCTSPDLELANTEYMFPFVSVVDCPQEQMLKSIKQTLVCTGITENAKFSRQLLDATHIDRLNIGPIKTIALNWLQPHEGNIVDFLFRARAFQNSPPPAH